MSYGRSISLLSLLALVVGGWLALVLWSISHESFSVWLAYHGRHTQATVVTVTRAEPADVTGARTIDEVTVRYDTPAGPTTTHLDLRGTMEGVDSPIPLPGGASISTFGAGSTIDIVYDPRQPTRALASELVSGPPSVVYRGGRSGGPAPEPAWTTTDRLLLGLLIATCAILTALIIASHRSDHFRRGNSSSRNGWNNGARI